MGAIHRALSSLDHSFSDRAHPAGACIGNKYPPAEPEVLRLLAPQRGLIATGQSQKQDLVSYRPARVFVIGVKRTPGFVELLLPPRQSRRISLRISDYFTVSRNEEAAAQCGLLPR